MLTCEIFHNNNYSEWNAHVPISVTKLVKTNSTNQFKFNENTHLEELRHDLEVRSLVEPLWVKDVPHSDQGKVVLLLLRHLRRRHVEPVLALSLGTLLLKFIILN